MDVDDVYEHVSEKQKIKALNLVVKADGYLSQRQLLKALDLYKCSAEILPDPAIIHKIKKLRKYMKRNDIDLGEDKENHQERNSSEKQVSPDIAIKPPNNNKTLIERTNFGVSSDHLTKEGSPKAVAFLTNKPAANFKSESPGFRKRDDVPDKNTDHKMGFAGSPIGVKEEDSDNDFKPQQKPEVTHQKLKTSPNTSAEVPQNKAHGDGTLSKKTPPAKVGTPAGGKRTSPTSDEPIRSFKDLRKRMYPHQKEGMKWLAKLFGTQRGGILGDDMGLGKTLQVIGYLYKMFEVNEVEHVMVVLPSALVLPWQSEIERWAPGLNFALFHGKSRVSRVKLLHNLQRQGGILLTTYGLIVTNYEELSKGPDGREFVWDYVFLDEGHKIKNPTKTQKAAHYIPASNRIIMTGTPIQNNLMELWSLFDFVHHGSLLGTIKTFKMNYENPITRARQKDASLEEKQLGYRMAQNLQKIIAPYFLRRTKSELMSDPNSGLPKLPRKNDIIVWVKMTDDQKKVYTSYLQLSEVKELMSSSRSPLVALNILKKLCDHLRLLSMRICKALGMLTTEESRKFSQDGVSHLDEKVEILEWTRQPGAEEPTNSVPSKEVKENDCAATQLTGIPDYLLFRESSKLMVVIELLSYMNATEHKCLVFSQSTKMLDIIQQILTNMSYRFLRMDGQVIKLEQRAEIIRRFETNKDIHIFLLTTQVGGVGLNLTVADRIIIVDPSWNPAIDSQAVDRIYRIGQKKNVIIFRLITCGSVEEKIYIRQLFKLSINKQATKESKDPFRYFTKQDLKQLFIVDDLSVSETQMQLEKMHAGKRVHDEVLDDQIKFLESMDTVFGVSDHDLVFSTEDGDQEVQMSNSRLQTLVERAEEAMRNEINEESRANSKKSVPGIQERRPPSVETSNSEPTKSLSSPLFTTYSDDRSRDEDSNQREVRHRKSNTGRNSISPPPSDAIVLSDHEPPRSDSQNDNIIVLSDTPSDVNDESNEVIMDSEDEQPPRNMLTKNKHCGRQAIDTEEPVPPTKITARNLDSPKSKNRTRALNSSHHSLANMTLMRAVSDSPLSPTKSGLKDVLVADSPDNFTRSVSSGSQCSSDSLTPNSGTKIMVAESDYESDESFQAPNRSLNYVNSSEVGEDDSRKFCSPVFRDVSLVVPSSSPRLGSLQNKDETNSPKVSTDQIDNTADMEEDAPVSPVSTDQVEDAPVSTDQVEDAPVSTDRFDKFSDDTDGIPVTSQIESMTKDLHKSLTLDDSVIVRSVKRKTNRHRVLSSSESESGSEVEKPRWFSGSTKKSVETAQGNEALEINKSYGNVNSLEKRSSSTSGGSRRKTRVISSDLSDNEDDDQMGSTSFSNSDKRIKRQGTLKVNRFVLLSSSDDDDENDSNAGTVNESSDKMANDSAVTMEELNIIVNPSKPIIQCVKTPPAKRPRSRVDKSPVFFQRNSPSPSEKTWIEMEADEVSRSGVECNRTDPELDTNSFSSAEEEEEEKTDEEEEETDEEEEEETDEEMEEDSEDESVNIELPELSSVKTKLYNQYINASREAYDDDNYVKALKNALRALKEDASDITLQTYALWLRKMTAK